jgi:hypothetical protein
MIQTTLILADYDGYKHAVYQTERLPLYFHLHPPLDNLSLSPSVSKGPITPIIFSLLLRDQHRSAQCRGNQPQDTPINRLVGSVHAVANAGFDLARTLEFALFSSLGTILFTAGL